MIEITIDSAALLSQFGSFKMQRVFRPAMAKTVVSIEAKMKKYPQPPSGSKYVRTGTLGRRWTHEVSARGSNQHAGRLTGKVGNNTTYGPFVQSAAFQARMHKGRWQTDAQVLAQTMPQVKQFFETAISNHFGQ